MGSNKLKRSWGNIPVQHANFVHGFVITIGTFNTQQDGFSHLPSVFAAVGMLDKSNGESVPGRQLYYVILSWLLHS